jgi:type III pantothenate kinase
MQSGLLWGYIAMVEGMVARFRAELGEDTQVIATGGLATLVGSHTASINAIDPWLTLEGLYLIWERMQP